MKQKTALMMSIERKEKELESLKSQNEWYIREGIRPKNLSRILFLSDEITADKLLLEKEMYILVSSYKSGIYNALTPSITPEIWYNETFESHE